ncbi:MAG TPA: hypothetical protein EYP22_02030 [Methanosarcinales archaeon]|nr:hypothetical protein [Methanosarcinales archaeon]
MKIENKFLNSTEYQWCSGCGYIPSMVALANAFSRLNLNYRDICIVTDIGCVGMSDKLFKCHTVHALHGRSTALAMGIKMASNKINNNLKVMVLIGDGGASIGLSHIIEAAKLNIDITVLLYNNQVYGMTGGQHSGYTLPKIITSTTPYGNEIRPINICKLLENFKVPFLARIMFNDKDLSNILSQAINTSGFSLVEIVSLCSYVTKLNKLTASSLKQLFFDNGFKFGIWKNKNFKIFELPKEQNKEIEFLNLKKEFENQLYLPIKILIGGSAGGGVQLASNLFSTAAALSGLEISLKGDYPVTVGKGHSNAELIFSPKEILFSGIEKEDVAIIVSEDGLQTLRNRLEQNPEMLLILDASLEIPDGMQNVIQKNFRSIGKKFAAISAIAFYLEQSKIFPLEALIKAIKQKIKSDNRDSFIKAVSLT